MICENGNTIKKVPGQWGTLHSVEKPRKAWTCRVCNTEIPVGEPHYRQAWHTDTGEHYSTRAHRACYHMGDAVRAAESAFATHILLILVETNHGWFLADEDAKEPHWERVLYPDVLNGWLTPMQIPGCPDHLKSLAYNGNFDPDARYYECQATVEAVRMMQEVKAHLEFHAKYEQPSLDKLFHKKHTPVSLDDYRKTKQAPTCPHDQTTLTMMTTAHDPDFRYLACGACGYAIEPQLVNFN